MKKTEDLFARFQAIYGGRWSACYETPEATDMAIAEWSEVIERMSDEELQAAMRWAKTLCVWPPALSEFMQAGLGVDEGTVRSRAIQVMRKEMAIDTYREREAAIKAGRERAMRELIAERCPALAPMVLPGYTPQRRLDS
jgi:hypothetical protein